LSNDDNLTNRMSAFGPSKINRSYSSLVDEEDKEADAIDIPFIKQRPAKNSRRSKVGGGDVELGKRASNKKIHRAVTSKSRLDKDLRSSGSAPVSPDLSELGRNSEISPLIN